MHNDPAAAVEAPPLHDRPEPVTLLGRWWPVIALAIMLLLFVRACVPAAPPAAPPAFDAAAATRTANEKALAALAAVTAATPMDAVLQALNMPVVNFASASAVIPEDAKPILEKAAAVMAMLPASVRLEVAGHTDSTGTAEANLALSRQRAQAVVEFLVARGVAGERLSVQGYGDSKPVAGNATEPERFRNRRIEVQVSAQ